MVRLEVTELFGNDNNLRRYRDCGFHINVNIQYDIYLNYIFKD